RDEDFDYVTHVPQTRSAQIQLDTMAALDEVSRRVGETRFVSIGFCFGGGESFLATTNHDLGLEGAVGFYAGLNRSKWGLESPPRLITHASASWLGVTPFCSAISPTRSTSSRFLRKFSPWKRGWCLRKSFSSKSSGDWKRPDRKPRPSGLYATKPIPRSRTAG